MEAIVPDYESILRSPERVAYHEAGHAVAWFNAGLSIKSVAIELDRSGETAPGGHVALARRMARGGDPPIFDRAALRRWKRRQRRNLEFVCAGSAADAIRYPELDCLISCGGDESDAGIALCLAREIATAESSPGPPREDNVLRIVAEAIDRVKARLERWENWFQVIALADLLLDRGTIDGREARRVCDRARREYLDFRASVRSAAL
jgi:hypothetical protein